MAIPVILLFLSLIARLEKRSARRRLLPAIIAAESTFVVTDGTFVFRNTCGQTIMINGQLKLRKEYIMNAYRTTNALAPCRGVVGGVIEDPPDPPDEDDDDPHPAYSYLVFYQ